MLTANTTIVAKRTKWGPGKWSIWTDEISRDSYIPIDGGKQRGPDWEDPKSRHAIISEKSVGELKVALPIRDRKRPTKSLPSKGGASSKA